MKHWVYVLGLAGVSAWGIGGWSFGWGDSPTARPVEFNRDIRPILSNHCFVCHGPDNNLRKADLRLDREKDVREDRGGYRVIVPGKPMESALYLRISHKEKAKRMPPAKHGKPLSTAQIDLLRRWIEEGGKYQDHWSLIAARKPAVPPVKNASWPRNPIDQFILARLEGEGLAPSPEADRRTLIRRLFFDLTGLPPEPKEVDAFLADTDKRAYENLVDRLLNSPHFGERLAMYWLDLVRYADTGGYHSDNHRDLYLFRDYVIKAFNDNMPFDRFTTEQLAGDLLPGSTRWQKIASGYNRALQTTEEGGAQAKEYSAKYAADRVRNLGSVWLGMTLGCCECHDHKFDPFLSREFYRLEAFFADITELPVGRQPQTTLAGPVQEKQLQKLDGDIASVQKLLADPRWAAEQAKWEERVKTAGARGLPKNIAALIKIDPARRNGKQKQDLTNYFRNQEPSLKEPREKLARLQKERANLLKSIPSTLVTMARAPRPIRVLRRGNWLDDSGEVVSPDVPGVLTGIKVSGRRPNRLDLAHWLTAPENPLTARVFVNRLWLLLFGQGIVKTPEDFGAQGAWPTHPELLDWLAVEFRNSGWNVRHMIKLMVTSASYRQTSTVTEKLHQADPYNLLLGRQARFRLPAELVRDNTLAISGLLSGKIGGPSVKPYQPKGYWQHLNFPKRTYIADKGDNQYRRGLYTYWQRTFLHPSLLAFDAPSREECTVDRPKSNTPLQALVLLNDPTYVEAARALAERMIRAGGKEVETRIHYAFRRALSRKARAEEIKVLADLYHKHRKEFDREIKSADALLHVGDRPVPKDIPEPELAAWTSVARVILNLHETITRN